MADPITLDSIAQKIADALNNFEVIDEQETKSSRAGDPVRTTTRIKADAIDVNEVLSQEELRFLSEQAAKDPKAMNQLTEKIDQILENKYGLDQGADKFTVRFQTAEPNAGRQSFLAQDENALLGTNIAQALVDVNRYADLKMQEIRNPETLTAEDQAFLASSDATLKRLEDGFKFIENYAEDKNIELTDIQRHGALWYAVPEAREFLQENPKSELLEEFGALGGLGTTLILSQDVYGWNPAYTQFWKDEYDINSARELRDYVNNPDSERYMEARLEFAVRAIETRELARTMMPEGKMAEILGDGDKGAGRDSETYDLMLDVMGWKRGLVSYEAGNRTYELGPRAEQLAEIIIKHENGDNFLRKSFELESSVEGNEGDRLNFTGKMTQEEIDYFFNADIALEERIEKLTNVMVHEGYYMMGPTGYSGMVLYGLENDRENGQSISIENVPEALNDLCFFDKHAPYKVVQQHLEQLDGSLTDDGNTLKQTAGQQTIASMMRGIHSFNMDTPLEGQFIAATKETEEERLESKVELRAETVTPITEPSKFTPYVGVGTEEFAFTQPNQLTVNVTEEGSTFGIRVTEDGNTIYEDLFQTPDRSFSETFPLPDTEFDKQVNYAFAGMEFSGPIGDSRFNANLDAQARYGYTTAWNYAGIDPESVEVDAEQIGEPTVDVTQGPNGVQVSIQEPDTRISVNYDELYNRAYAHGPGLHIEGTVSTPLAKDGFLSNAELGAGGELTGWYLLDDPDLQLTNVGGVATLDYTVDESISAGAAARYDATVFNSGRPPHDRFTLTGNASVDLGRVEVAAEAGYQWHNRDGFSPYDGGFTGEVRVAYDLFTEKETGQEVHGAFMNIHHPFEGESTLEMGTDNKAILSQGDVQSQLSIRYLEDGTPVQELHEANVVGDAATTFSDACIEHNTVTRKGQEAPEEQDMEAIIQKLQQAEKEAGGLQPLPQKEIEELKPSTGRGID